MKMRALLVESDQKRRAQLWNLLRMYQVFTLAGEADTSEEAVTLLQKQKVDVVFCNHQPAPPNRTSTGDWLATVLAQNQPDRCYYCKMRIFSAIARAAWKDGFTMLMDGPESPVYIISDELYTCMSQTIYDMCRLPELPALTAANVQCDADALLTALDFNPHTNNRYPSSDGSEVINEGSRSLRIHTNGTVVYRSGGSTALSLDVEEETLTVGEAASRTGALLASLSSGLTGDASLYLEEATVSGSSMTLRFGYQAGGVPIYFSDGSSAAEVTLSGATVSSLTLRLRSYTALEDSSILLPLRQALAIAADQEGGELSIGYADSGSNSVRATWLLG